MAELVRVVGTAHVGVRDLVADDYSGTREMVSSGSLLVPAEPSVSLVFNITEPAAGGPDAFVTGTGHIFRSAQRPLRSAGGAAQGREWVAVRLSPPGAYTVFGTAVSEAVDFGELFGGVGRELVEAMREAPGRPERFALLDRFLLERADRGPRPAPEVAYAWRRLVGTGGRIPIGRLAAEVGWSHAYLIKRFHRQLGRPPKTLARLLRFRSVMRRIRRGESWQQAAFDAGYYDQSHLARDIREFTGTSLTRYLARALPCGCVTTGMGETGAPPQVR
ncbi:helix-turn-helix domain-containing protein [Embleya sp. MST-111070]|uniref:helix-turn-helix domain-containing protein n=1 Tax=Embleya sp. MST-111070 TaxID=3398231 RepID=UPI003F73785E